MSKKLIFPQETDWTLFCQNYKRKNPVPFRAKFDPSLVFEPEHKVLNLNKFSKSLSKRLCIQLYNMFLLVTARLLWCVPVLYAYIIWTLDMCSSAVL
jgi:hypothetical protein